MAVKPLQVIAGTTVTVQATFSNAAGVPTDPTDVYLDVSAGVESESATQYHWTSGSPGSFSHPATGTFSYNIDTTTFSGGTVSVPFPVYRQWSCVFADGTKVVSGLGTSDPGLFQCIDPELGPVF